MARRHSRPDRRGITIVSDGLEYGRSKREGVSVARAGLVLRPSSKSARVTFRRDDPASLRRPAAEMPLSFPTHHYRASSARSIE
jgi:hypothetical protein